MLPLIAYVLQNFFLNFLLILNPVDSSDSYPMVLDEDIVEKKTIHIVHILSNFKIVSKLKLKFRKRRAISRGHDPNPNTYAEKYAHHLLISFHLFRNEEKL